MTQINMLNTSPMSPTTLNSPWTKDGTYIIEATRKAHACCKTCDAIIEAGRLRVGVVYQHLNGFVCINWHHIECYKSVSHIPLCCFEGLNDLNPQQQKVVERCHLARNESQYLPETHTCAA